MRWSSQLSCRCRGPDRDLVDVGKLSRAFGLPIGVERRNGRFHAALNDPG